MRTASTLLFGGALFCAVAFACSDDSGDAGSGGKGSSGGTTAGNQPGGSGGKSGTGGASDPGGDAGASGASPTGGTSGNSPTGGTSGNTATGGAGGAGAPAGGSAGDSLGGEGGRDHGEATPEELCEGLICLEEHDARLFEKPNCRTQVPLDVGSRNSGGGGAAGAGGGYDRALCLRDCLVVEEVDVPRQCGDESLLYWQCALVPTTWTCIDDRNPAHAYACDPMLSALTACRNSDPDELPTP